MVGESIRGKGMLLILLKNPSGQKETVKRTISDVSLGHSNRVQTKLARKNFQHFSYSFTHLQNRGFFSRIVIDNKVKRFGLGPLAASRAGADLIRRKPPSCRRYIHSDFALITSALY